MEEGEKKVPVKSIKLKVKFAKSEALHKKMEKKEHKKHEKEEKKEEEY